VDKVIVHSCYEAGRDGLLVAPLVGRAMHRQRRGGRGLLSIIFHESNSANREPRIKRKSLMFGLGFRVAIGNRRAEAAEAVIAFDDAESDPGNSSRLG